MSSIVDLVTARSLHRSLTPGNDFDRVARELAAIAGHRAEPLEGAIVRLDIALGERGSWVVERARFALAAALDLVNTALVSSS